ncbi:MAG: hypothetical protein PHY34_00475 [Patescibacteria group bacterium]|nr:hypothetical protein [Patescibacteria group bacterium]MDD5715896.1 hypothetical protein [Patescibacteria group bacterium]
MNNTRNAIVFGVALAVVAGACAFIVFQKENSESTGTGNTNTRQTRFTSAEYHYSIEYPSAWWHHSVPMEGLIEESDLAIRTLSLEEFGSGSEADHKVPYTETDERISMGIIVYSLADGVTEGELIADINTTEATVTEKKIGEKSVQFFLRDDSRHEIESARGAMEYYIFSSGQYYYAIDFAAQSPEVINANRSLIDKALSTFSILVTNVVQYEFSGGVYVLLLQTYNNGEQSIIMRNQLDGTSRELGANEIRGLGKIDERYTSFIWNNDRTRLNFISIIPAGEHISFQYIDITEPDPYANTGISYEDPDHLITTDVVIEKVENGVFFLRANGKRFTMDPSQGEATRPVLVEDAN